MELTCPICGYKFDYTPEPISADSREEETDEIYLQCPSPNGDCEVSIYKISEES